VDEHGAAPPERTGRIVVGIDGSPASLAALRWALDEAVNRGEDVEVLACYQTPMSIEASGYDAAFMTEDELSAGARQVLAEAMAASRDDIARVEAAGHAVRARTLEGSPGPALALESKDATALVVGRRGHSGMSRLLLGSVSRHVVDHASCPVVVVPSSN
jgi:nucleotide-binding universal stress UspA family protein